MSGQRPMPVRWYACGYRDGYTGVERSPGYFDAGTEPELVAYGKGYVAGRQATHREHLNRLLLARAEEIAGC